MANTLWPPSSTCPDIFQFLVFSHDTSSAFLDALLSDTLLNVFLAIAVDNLANAQELTKVWQ